MQCPSCRVPAFENELTCAACNTKMHPDALAEGTTIAGRYRLEGLLGAGGFAITYLGMDLLLNRRVALKELFWNQCRRQGESVMPAGTDAVTSFEDLKARTLREAQALGAFNSDRVVRVFDCFQANGTVYVSMEYLQGTTLREELRSHPGFRLPPARFVEIFRALLQALAIVHDQGLLHRDIKPDNVMLVSRRGPVMIDFGAVRPDNPTHTLSGVSFASGGYTPLEQTAGHRNVGRHSDIYALGATMYEALTGRAPTYAGDRIDADDSDRMQAPNAIDPTIPAPLSDFVMRLLTVDWRQRPNSAQQLSQEFEAALVQQPTPLPSRPVVQPDPNQETIRYQPPAGQPVPSQPVPSQPVPSQPVPSQPAFFGGDPPHTRETAPLAFGGTPPIVASPGSGRRNRLIGAGVVAALIAAGIAVVSQQGGPDSGAGRNTVVDSRPRPTTTLDTTAPPEPTTTLAARPSTTLATSTVLTSTASTSTVAGTTSAPTIAAPTTLAATVNSSAAPTSTTAPAVALRTVRIGVISGGGTIDLDGQRAVMVAIGEAKKQLGAQWQLDVVAIDDRGDPVRARKAAETLVGDPSVVAIIGPTSSDTVEAALPVIAGAGIPVFTPTATRVSLTRDATGTRRAKELFRLIPNDAAQGRAAARLAREAGATKIALVHDGSSYGDAVAAGVAAEIGTGFTSIDVTATSAPDQVATSLLDGQFSDVIFAGANEVLFARTARSIAAKQPDVRYWSGDALFSAVWGTQSGAAAPKLQLVLSGVPNSKLARAADYTAATSGTKGISPDGFGAYTLDIARFVVATITTATAPLQNSNQARALLLGTVAKDYVDGVAGGMQFDEFGEPKSARLSVFGWAPSRRWVWQRAVQL